MHQRDAPRVRVRHNPPVPSNQRFPHARRRWRPRARYVLIGAAGALAVLVVLPAAAPRGSVLDLDGQGTAPNAIAQGPTAEAAATATAVASPVAVALADRPRVAGPQPDPQPAHRHHAPGPPSSRVVSRPAGWPRS